MEFGSIRQALFAAYQSAEFYPKIVFATILSSCDMMLSVQAGVTNCQELLDNSRIPKKGI
ncbi:MAG: hypothetical protein JWM11_465 [Planctomycetaceae bacterium]|nr:hypothetical protein [Planctomycetaceae bacterium]